MAFVSVPDNPAPEGAEESWLDGRGGVRVRMMLAPARGPARGSVILAPGRTEFIEKYFEVLRALQARGFATFCIDWRGQGLSGRQAKNPQKGHLVSIDDAVTDLAASLSLNAARLPRPHIVLAHSMGGAIMLRALQTRRVEADAAAFSAPMWGIPGVTPQARRMARFVTSLGGGAAYAPGVDRKWRRETFAKNALTHDEARYARSMDLVEADMRLALAGPTIGWVQASIDAMDGFQRPGALAHLKLPVLVATAGEEALVDNAAHDAVVASLPNATHITIAGARHEILMETDALQNQFWSAFDALADRVAPRQAA
ncbi:MAG: alpha/beta fold hydrolase [Hyphomonadaceae bacterium]